MARVKWSGHVPSSAGALGIGTYRGAASNAGRRAVVLETTTFGTALRATSRIIQNLSRVRSDILVPHSVLRQEQPRARDGHGTFTMSPSFTRCTDETPSQCCVASSCLLPFRCFYCWPPRGRIRTTTLGTALRAAARIIQNMSRVRSDILVPHSVLQQDQSSARDEHGTFTMSPSFTRYAVH